MIDPEAPRRLPSLQRHQQQFLRRLWAGAGFVLAAVVMSLLTEPLANLMFTDGNEVLGSWMTLPLTAMNVVLFLLAYAMPMALVGIGLAVPVVAAVRFCELAHHPRHPSAARRKLIGRGSAVQLAVAETLVLAAVAVGVVYALNPGQPTDHGLAEPKLTFVPRLTVGN